MNAVNAFRCLVCTAVIFTAACVKNEIASGTEITNGNCVGTIYDPEGSAVAGAVVRLIPEEYDPRSPGDAHIDSTTTNGTGGFSFTVAKSDRYNVYAQKSAVSCIRQSLYISADDETVADDTLQESGWITGFARPESPDGINSVYVLIPGTGIYTTPSDSTGDFRTPLLPEGTYRLRIIADRTGDEVFDSAVVVTRGSETTLPPIRISPADTPSLSVTYDSATMYATVSWPLPDTAQLASYTLRRISAAGNDTSLTVDKSLTSCTDDLLRFEGDTVRYRLEGIGKEGMTGYTLDSRDIPVCNVFRCVRSIDVQYDLSADSRLRGVQIDRSGNIYISSVGAGPANPQSSSVNPVSTVRKFDPTGTARTIFTDSSAFIFEDGLRLDDDGDPYGVFGFNTSGPIDSVKFVQFDQDLNPRKTLLIDTRDTVMNLQTAKFAVFPDGAFLLALQNGVSADGITSYRIMTFDSTAAKKRDFYLYDVYTIIRMTNHGAVVFTEEKHMREDAVYHYSSGRYDTAFNRIASFEDFEFLAECQPPLWPSVKWGFEMLFESPGGRIFSCSGPVPENALHPTEVEYDKRHFLLITDAEKHVLCRKMMQSATRFEFTPAGNIHAVSYKTGEYFRIEEYAADPKDTAGTR